MCTTFLPILLSIVLPHGEANPEPTVQAEKGWERELIGVPHAWRRSTHSCAIVAVVDTGVALEHPALAPNLWRNPGEIPGNGIDDDENGKIDDIHGWDFVDNDSDPSDEHGHGTHCAGIIAGVQNLETQAAGIAPDARLMVVRAFKDASSSVSEETLAEAIRYAVRSGAWIVNCSWGRPQTGLLLTQAMDEARARGVLVVVAAGNGGDDAVADDLDRYPFFPAALPHDNLLVVTAMKPLSLSWDGQGRLFSFANYGVETVDLAAPGGSVWSTGPAELGYTWRQGTSVATAMVSGAAALIWARTGGTAVQVKARLLEDSRSHAPLRRACRSGGALFIGAACSFEDAADGSPLNSGEISEARGRTTLVGKLQHPVERSDGTKGGATLETLAGRVELDCGRDRALQSRVCALSGWNVVVTGKVGGIRGDDGASRTLRLESIRLRTHDL